MIGLFNDAYVIFFSDFLYKIICCGYSFELPRQVYKNKCCWYSFELPQGFEAVQMSTNNIGFYKEADKKYMAVI